MPYQLIVEILVKFASFKALQISPFFYKLRRCLSYIQWITMI